MKPAIPPEFSQKIIHTPLTKTAHFKITMSSHRNPSEKAKKKKLLRRCNGEPNSIPIRRCLFTLPLSDRGRVHDRLRALLITYDRLVGFLVLVVIFFGGGQVFRIEFVTHRRNSTVWDLVQRMARRGSRWKYSGFLGYTMMMMMMMMVSLA